jgi:hypothetical protein
LEVLMQGNLHLGGVPQYLESVWKFGHDLGFRMLGKKP